MIYVLPLLGMALFFLAMSLGGAIDKTTEDQIKKSITRLMMSIFIASLLLVFAGAIVIMV